MYPAVCLPFSVPSVGYHMAVSTPGSHGVCTLDTGVKGRKSENMADYIGNRYMNDEIVMTECVWYIRVCGRWCRGGGRVVRIGGVLAVV